MNNLKRTLRTIPLALLLLLNTGLLQASPGKEAYAAGNMERAERLLSAELQSQADPEKQKLLGIIAMSKNNFKKSYEIFSELAAALPDDADAQYWLGASAGSLAANVSLFRAAGYARKTRGAFARAIKLEPTHVAAHQGLITYYLQAPGFLGGDKDAALALAESMVAFAPVDGRLQVASILSKTNKSEQARATLHELAEAYPNDPRALVRLGFYYQGEDEYDRAHAMFQQATKTDKEGEEANEARLGALYQVGRTAVFSDQNIAAGIAALTEYIAAEKLAPALPDVNWAFFRLGQLHLLAGEDAAAREVLVRADSATQDKNLRREIRRLTSGD